MFELNWMGLPEVALKQGITLQDVLFLSSCNTQKNRCKFQHSLQNKENI